jgi:hypothetical protein
MLSQVSGFQTLPKSFSSFHAPDYVIFRISEQKNEEIEYENTKSKVTVDRVHNKKKQQKQIINDKRKIFNRFQKPWPLKVKQTTKVRRNPAVVLRKWNKEKKKIQEEKTTEGLKKPFK